MKIRYNSHLRDSNDDDVLSFGPNYHPFLCKFGRFKDALIRAITLGFSQRVNEQLKSQGIEIKVTRYAGKDKHGHEKHDLILADWEQDVNCEILRVGSKGWEKGKFRIKVSLEFCPDEPEIEEAKTITEPESPLDDLRRLINEEQNK